MNEVRALLLTNVVDSTQLSQTLGDAAMAELWAAHDRVARDLLLARGGREIDKTDGMLLLFDAAADALAYAAYYHRALKRRAGRRSRIRISPPTPSIASATTRAARRAEPSALRVLASSPSCRRRHNAASGSRGPGCCRTRGTPRTRRRLCGDEIRAADVAEGSTAGLAAFDPLA